LFFGRLLAGHLDDKGYNFFAVFFIGSSDDRYFCDARVRFQGEPAIAMNAQRQLGSNVIEVTRKGRRVAHVEGVCHNAAGDLVARAHGTWHIWPRKPA